MKKILICGGRMFGECKNPDDSKRPQGNAELSATVSALNLYVNRKLDEGEIICVINGGCRTGVDRIARTWAMLEEYPCLTIPARWSKYDKAAGPKRNAIMVAQKPDGVIAFPGGRGTADMVRRARAAGIPVWRPYGGANA